METSFRALLVAAALLVVTSGLTFAQSANTVARPLGATTGDSIHLIQETTTASPLTLWGIDTNWNQGNWHLNVSDNGDSANFNGPALGTSGSWVAVRGAFKHPLIGNTTSSGAIVVSGQVTFVGEGPDVGSGMRYGIYNTLNPGVLTGVGSDSAYWRGISTAAYGYTISPQSGFDETDQGEGWGAGATQWIVMGGDWLSSFSGAVGFGPVTLQQVPAGAIMNAGTYDFAFSVHPQTNGTKLVNFYLIREDSSGKTVYWDAASLVDTTAQTRSDTLNSIEFGVQGGPNMTGMIFSNVVDSLGPDISIPTPPWQNYYINEWGIYGRNAGGWNMILKLNQPIGNVTIAGDSAIPTFQHAYLLGALAPAANGYNTIDSTVNGYNTTDSTLYITGDLHFAGGGFQAPNSFSFGLFNNSPGSDTLTKTAGYQWTGANDSCDGYLFIPPSGTTPSPVWETSTRLQGNIGAVVGEPWQSTTGKSSYVLAGVHQSPMGAVAGPGNYVFAISVAPPNSNGAQQVNVALYKPDSSYVWSASVMDNHKPLAAASFNSIIFGLQGGNTTDSLVVTNVYVEMNKPVPVGKVTSVVSTSSNLPMSFALYQNYPNPFNPTTEIRFSVPGSELVTLQVYDILGQLVKTLVDKVEQPGSYEVQFNGSGLASGVYFYRLQSGGYDSIMKMLLLK